MAELDRWILSELNRLAQQVDAHLDNYNPTDAGRRIQEFIDVLSNWYVRRSRAVSGKARTTPTSWAPMPRCNTLPGQPLPG